jgi:hypothetical protein
MLRVGSQGLTFGGLGVFIICLCLLFITSLLDLISFSFVHLRLLFLNCLLGGSLSWLLNSLEVILFVS